MKYTEMCRLGKSVNEAKNGHNKTVFIILVCYCIVIILSILCVQISTHPFFQGNTSEDQVF